MPVDVQALSADFTSKLLNNPRYRAVLAGGSGGLLGWIVAEVASRIVGGPGTFVGAALVGLLVGAGIGLALAMAEGLVIRNWLLVRRGAVIGLAIGASGGLMGAIIAQSVSTAGGGSVFSSELSERLLDAGAQSGEVEIGLSWNNTNDLDLHVEDPNGEVIYYQHRVSRSGGELDVDRNADCVGDLSTKPVEHVVWISSPPEGQYQVYVDHFKNCGTKDPTSFHVEIKLGSATRPFDGSSSFGESKQLVDTFQYPGQAQGQNPILRVLVRVICWAMFGALVGAAQGVTRGAALAIRNAALGGTIGGFAGGLFFEVIVAMGAGDVASRLVGFVVLGACIGLCIVLVEQALSAILWVTSGRQEGRQIFIDRPLMRLGRSDALEVFLGDDADVAAHHATIQRDGTQHVISAVGGSILVNGANVPRSALTEGDRVQIGKTRLRYGRDKSAVPATSDVGADRPPSPAKKAMAPPPPPPPPPKRA